MGPRRSSNYGTFVAPTACYAEETEAYRDGGNSTNVDQSHIAPASSYSSPTSTDYYILSCGLGLTTRGAEVVISEIDDDIARVACLFLYSAVASTTCEDLMTVAVALKSKGRGLCEGDVVTHINGEPLLGSLKVGRSLIDEAGDTLALRVRPGESTHASAGTSRLGKYHVVQHVVRQGDSVKALAKRYGVTDDEVRLWNRKYFPVGEPGFLCPGQVLTLRDTTANQPRDAQNARSQAMSCGPSASGRKLGGGGGRKRMLYQVREGDTLKSICVSFNQKEAEVRGLNRSIFPVGEPGAVSPGQMLTVFVEESNSGLVSEDGGRQLAEDERERAFLQSCTRLETRKPFISGERRGARVTGT